MKIDGVVIVYNPLTCYLENIKTYVNYVDVLYVIDNSNIVNEKFVQEIKKYCNVIYMKMKENKGIAYPLNLILKKIENTQWLLTMDQDSYFTSNDIKKYINDVSTVHKKDVYAITLKIFSPITMLQTKCSNVSLKKFSPKDVCITSGCLLNVQLAQKIGGFDEKLFIDLVDTEFCFRGKASGYHLLQNNTVNLIHHLGDMDENKINHILYLKQKIKHNIPVAFLKFIEKMFSSHGKIRWYYIFRNTLYLLKLYKAERCFLFFQLFRQGIMFILFENNKIEKSKYILYGFKSFKNNKFGAYKNK